MKEPSRSTVRKCKKTMEQRGTGLASVRRVVAVEYVVYALGGLADGEDRRIERGRQRRELGHYHKAFAPGSQRAAGTSLSAVEDFVSVVDAFAAVTPVGIGASLTATPLAVVGASAPSVTPVAVYVRELSAVAGGAVTGPRQCFDELLRREHN